MESLDIINENDEVVGSATRDEVYAQKLRHRIVHVMLRDSNGKLLLQKRSGEVSFKPGHWVTSAGGHVRSGESFEQAALREMSEEIGVSIPLEMKFKDQYISVEQQIPKILETFEGSYSGTLRLDPNEVAEAVYFTVPEIQTMIENGEKFHPELLFLFYKHYLTKK